MYVFTFVLVFFGFECNQISIWYFYNFILFFVFSFFTLIFFWASDFLLYSKPDFDLFCFVLEPLVLGNFFFGAPLLSSYCYFSMFDFFVIIILFMFFFDIVISVFLAICKSYYCFDYLFFFDRILIFFVFFGFFLFFCFNFFNLKTFNFLFKTLSFILILVLSISFLL